MGARGGRLPDFTLRKWKINKMNDFPISHVLINEIKTWVPLVLAKSFA
jgi:hypothetical protein